MDRRSSRVALALLVTLALAAGAAAAKSSPTRHGADIETLNWATDEAIRGLDYVHSADAGTATVVSLGCETLVQYDKLGRPKPNLASAVTVRNPTTYVYTIRKGVKFWDGSLLTPADVVFSLQQAASTKNKSQVATLFSSMKSVSATGPSTVTIRLKEPDPFFRYTIAVTYIVQKRYWQAHLKDLGTPQALVMCTGPFQFTKFVADQEVDATAFDGYWGGRPSVRQVNVKFIVSEPTRLLAMRSGGIDGSFRVPLTQVDQWQRLDNVRVQFTPELRTAYLSLDVAQPPWNDIHVRRAVAYAFDKVGLVKAVLRGHGAPAPTMPPPEQWGDLLPQQQVKRFYASLPQYRYSLAKAKAELKRSAFPDGFSATLPYPNSEQYLGQAAQALAGSLKKIGIKLTVKEIPSSQWFNILYSHPTPIGPQIISWGVDYPDPADAAHFIYDSRYATPNAFNTSNYKNARMDALLRAQQNARTRGARAAALVRLLRVASTDLPYIPIWYQDIAMALSTKYRYPDWGTWYLYTPWAFHIKTAK
jgi:peptide/nickel transport system substrate-binding protein